MHKTSVLSRLGHLFEAFGSAVAVSKAVEAGRQPRLRDLRVLGIDPERFRQVGR